MQQVHIEVARVGIQEGTFGVAWAQHGEVFQRLRFRQFFEPRARAQKFFRGCLLSLRLKEQGGTRHKQRAIGEAGRRVEEETVAGAGEGQHGGRAIIGLKGGG